MTTSESTNESLPQHSPEDLAVLGIVGDKILNRYQDEPVAGLYLNQSENSLKSMMLRVVEYGWVKIPDDKLLSTEKQGYEQTDLVAANKGLVEITRKLSVDHLGDTHFEVSIKSDDPDFNNDDGKEERIKKLMKGELKTIHTSVDQCEIQTFDDEEIIRYAPKPNLADN